MKIRVIKNKRARIWKYEVHKSFENEVEVEYFEYPTEACAEAFDMLLNSDSEVVNIACELPEICTQNRSYQQIENE